MRPLHKNLSFPTGEEVATYKPINSPPGATNPRIPPPTQKPLIPDQRGGGRQREGNPHTKKPGGRSPPVVVASLGEDAKVLHAARRNAPQPPADHPAVIRLRTINCSAVVATQDNSAHRAKLEPRVDNPLEAGVELGAEFLGSAPCLSRDDFRRNCKGIRRRPARMSC